MTRTRRAGPSGPRRITAQEAAALVRSDTWIDYGGSLCQPEIFDAALALRAKELHGVRIRAGMTVRPPAVLEADPHGEHFCWNSMHFSAYDRRKHEAGIAHYIPINLGEVEDYYRRFLPQADIAIVKMRPMDAQGCFNFGPTAAWMRAIVDTAKTVIVEESSALPHAVGDPEQTSVHLGEVDYIIQGTEAPIPELPNPPPSDVDRAVGRLIAGEVEDGACLQIGIGGMPNAVCSVLRESSVRNLGIHTEMLTDGIVDLYKAGRVTGAYKQLDPGKIVYTFALGSRYLYEALDRNADFLLCPGEYTNVPHIIMRNERMVSINNTTQIDLQGQAASESDGHRHVSGTGGQLQFVRGAYASKRGKSFICLSSTYEKRGARRSRIVLALTPGNIVTTPRSDVMYVVTEYGMVNLKGRSVPERAKALIDIAHPDFREGLEREAREHGLIPRGFF